jgi:hypothetical protein
LKLAIAAGILGIIGTLLGIFIAYRLSLRLARTQAKHAENLATINAQRIAGEKLRAAFAPEIAQYNLLFRNAERKPSGAVADLLKDALPKHATAIEEYQPFVPPKSQRAYQEAWENYHTPFEEIEINMAFWAYEDDPEFFKERIEAILKFTKPF